MTFSRISHQNLLDENKITENELLSIGPLGPTDVDKRYERYQTQTQILKLVEIRHPAIRFLKLVVATT